ncbi:MAG: hypothetical protein LUG62_12370 [Clostridiales bacterium]|nr:hypothetical protein [Clostridiales bacterium]
MGMLNNSMLNPQNNPYRRALRLDGLWKFRPDPESIGMEQGWEDGLTAVPRKFISFLRTSMERKNAAILVKYEAEISGKSTDGGGLAIAAEARGDTTGLVARATGKTGILQISPGRIWDLYHITAYLKDRDAILDEYRQEIVFDGL